MTDREPSVATGSAEADRMHAYQANPNIGIEADRTGNLELSLTDRTVEVLEEACRRRADWTQSHGYDEESYTFEDFTFVLTSDGSLTVTDVEAAQLADAATWLAAMAHDDLADDALEVADQLWGVVDEGNESKEVMTDGGSVQPDGDETPDRSVSGVARPRSHVCMACGSPAQLVDDGRRAACPDCGNDWIVGPEPCERCNDDGWIWVVKTDAPCPDCTAYPEPGERQTAGVDRGDGTRTDGGTELCQACVDRPATTGRLCETCHGRIEEQRRKREQRPDWTDPTTCPECGTRGSELRIEWHLHDEHGWGVIERDFESEYLVEPRSPDAGKQTTLTDGGIGPEDTEGDR